MSKGSRLTGYPLNDIYLPMRYVKME